MGGARSTHGIGESVDWIHLALVNAEMDLRVP
jgi:hypothetical protein